MQPRRIRTPLSEEVVMSLRAGDRVLLSGLIYTARDAAHKRMLQMLKRAEALPIELKGQVIYYAGPSPAPPGRPVGSIGPTTSGRMDPYTPRLLELGLKGMIGKGNRSSEVKDALKRYKAVYFGATGGAAALLAQRVKRAEVVAFEDLGPEAIRALEVEDFPLVVLNDPYGGDLYEEGTKRYAKEV
ncbi:TPA: Fe-S-containing hydro-lyase [Candidatus Bipolaricaulota bacterium]|nr:Fe-S-containing hydro-lyase [Candidatus Bipolaricaulota bacterium]